MPLRREESYEFHEGLDRLVWDLSVGHYAHVRPRCGDSGMASKHNGPHIPREVMDLLIYMHSVEYSVQAAGVL